MRARIVSRSERLFIGIDPGTKGCISILQPSGIVTSFSLEDYNAADVLKKYKNNVICTIEEPQIFGKHSNPVSILALGKNYGYLTGILEAVGIPYLSVSPVTWKKYFALTKKEKSASIDKVHELFPGANLYRTPKCKSEHDGIADSILIADYGRYYIKNVLENAASSA